MADESRSGRRLSRRRGGFFLAIVVLVCVYGSLVFVRGSWNPLSRGMPSRAMTFDGETAALSDTRIVPTLDTPVETGKNVIWCASFVAGWRQLESNVLGEPVQLIGAEAECARLGRARDPADYMAGDSFFAAAGMKDEGILTTIEKDMARLFPDKDSPVFPGIAPGSFVLYSYLETRLPFPIPYFDSLEALSFVDSAGNATPVRSFGIRREDGDRYGELRGQVQVLSLKRNSDREVEEFAVDLCRDSEPNQIVVAMVERKETLEATLDALEKTMAEQAKNENRLYFGGSDVLLVPEMFWRLLHHFAEFEGREFANAALADQSMDVAVQEIQFRLDRSGAELRSEASANWASEGPTHFVANRPFLIYMKKRGATQPFFVLWVDNAELLRGW